MVYITGDLHGDFSRFSSPAMRRLRKGDTLIVCGDFGFIWNGDKKEEALLKKIGSRPYAVLFLDGCHENFDLLKEYPVTDWKGGRAQVISGNLVHLMRGQLYTLEGYRFFTFGGGESREYDLRDGAKTWWEEEMPSAGEMTQGLETLAAAGNQVDFILTHEPSARARVYLAGRNDRLDGVNVYLNRVEEIASYKRWFFGSLHMDKTMSKQHMAVFQTVVPVVESHAKRK